MAIDSSGRKQQERNKVHGDTSSEQQQSLRRRAEAKLAAAAEYPELGIDQEKNRMVIHELQLQQLELEIQNEELKALQETLAKSEARYLNLYDFAPVGYVTVNKAGVIVEANHTATVLLQRPPRSLAKEMFFRLIFPNDQDIFYNCHKAIFATNKPQTCKLRLLRQHGPPFWARLESAPIRTQGGQITVCRMALIDIDGGVQSAEAKTRQEEQTRLLRKAESLTRVAGAFVHHCNNMLTVIIGNLEMVMGEAPQGTALRESLDAAKEGADRLTQLNSSILTALGRKIGKHFPLDVSELCRRILADQRIPSNVEMRTDLPANGPMVAVNAEQIRLMLCHMLANGWDSLAKGQGVVCLAVTTIMPKEIPITNRFPVDWTPEDHPYACLLISDNGCGINSEEVEDIFEPFFTKKLFGRGLGLPIILGIARAHGGAVTVASTIGVGTVLQVFLPISLPERPLEQREAVGP